MCENYVHRWKHLITTAMVYKITFKDYAGYYTVTKAFDSTDELGKFIQNELANYGGNEIGIEEFESMQDMLEKRYKNQNES
jgi:hypothetical protein